VVVVVVVVVGWRAVDGGDFVVVVASDVDVASVGSEI
jgi:hypothetical protein